MADQQQNDDSNPLTDIQLERFKMYQDSFKHMTTFSSGVILLASAVTGGLFLPKLGYPLVLGASIVLLAFGALSAMLGLIHVPRYIDSAIDGSSTRFPPSYLGQLLRTSVFMTYLGLTLFAVFAFYNVTT